MGDRGALDLIAGLKFKFHPGSPETPPTYSHGGLPAEGYEVDAIEVVSLAIDLGDGKTAPIPLTLELCEWIAETADTEYLAINAKDDLQYEAYREGGRDHAA
jgi:hypothetical protein